MSVGPDFWLQAASQAVSLALVVGAGWKAIDKRLRSLEVELAELRAQLKGAGLL